MSMRHVKTEDESESSDATVDDPDMYKRPREDTIKAKIQIDEDDSDCVFIGDEYGDDADYVEESDEGDDGEGDDEDGDLSEGVYEVLWNSTPISSWKQAERAAQRK